MQYTPDDTVTIKIVEALGGSLVPDANGNYRCCCPSHADARPSLSVRDRDGKALFRCFAGCRQSDVSAALQRLGLLPGRPAQAHAQRRLSILPGPHSRYGRQTR